MIRKALLLLLTVLAGAGTAWAQDVSARFQGQVIGSRGLPLANQNVAVCTQPANTTTQPCSPLATLATSTTTTSGGTNPLTTDTNGNFFFYAAPGKYTVQVYGPQVGTPFVQPDTLVGASGPASLTTLTVSGAATLTGRTSLGNRNDMLFVDNTQAGALYPTCQSAVTAAGANNRIIYVPPTYNGVADCPSQIGANIVYWNFDSTRNYPNNSWNWFQKDPANTESMVHVMFQRSAIGAGGAILGPYFTTNFSNGVVGTGVGVDGFSAEANTSGTIPGTTGTLTGTLPVIQAIEANVTLNTTGGAITRANGVEGYINSGSGNTTVATTATGVYGLGCNNLLGTAPTNCYGLYGEDQIGGTTRNYALGAKGYSLMAYSANKGAAGVDVEDTSNVAHHLFLMDSGNQMHIRAPNTNGILLEDSAAGDQLDWTSAGVAIRTALFFGAGVKLKDSGSGTAMALTLKKGSGAGNYTNATTSYTVADSTNLCFTVTIPAGWKLGISASGALSTATAAVVAQAALTDNASCSTANAGIIVETAPLQGAATGVADAFALNWVITGDGASHNIAMQFKTSNAADTASLINSSATITPTMKFTLMPSN